MKACSWLPTRHCRIAVMPVNDASTVAGRAPRPLAAGPVAQWLEPAAHNGLVAGSSPAGATKIGVIKPLLDRTGSPHQKRPVFVHTLLYLSNSQTSAALPARPGLRPSI